MAKSNYSVYMRSKLRSKRLRRISRFGSIIHWIGFLCLAFSIILLSIAGLNESVDWFDALDNFLDWMFDFETLGYLNSGDDLGFWMVWLAVTHWPIKFVLTGNKSFFPWNN